MTNPISRFILNLIGNLQGYGGCECCGDRWSWKEGHTVMDSEHTGTFFFCRECFWSQSYDKLMTLTRIKVKKRGDDLCRQKEILRAYRKALWARR